MTLPTETVTQAGSGLTFINNYDSSVSDAYRGAILTAEHFLESHFTNQVTITVDFTLAALDGNAAAQNSFEFQTFSYTQFVTALKAHATSADDLLAVNGLPATDPSNGAGFAVPIGEAVALGLLPQTNDGEVDVTLNSTLPWTFGQDAVGAIEHELTEGGFGRIASLGIQNPGDWAPLDLFRFTAAGVRDFTGGSDGVRTFFGLDSTHVTSLQFHSAVNAAGVFDGEDLGDWENNVHGDAFGPGGPGSPGVVSATDLRVVDILGWNTATFTPAPDEFASSFGDTSHPFGQLTVGHSATGDLQFAGDRDLFQVQLIAGDTYTITETGQHGGEGTLADPFLRLDNIVGATVEFNDDIGAQGSNPDSSLVFTPTVSGTYYVEAGAFADGYAGSYTVAVAQTGTAPVPGDGNDSIQATASMPDVETGAGNDTIVGLATANDYLRGGAGDDSIQGGASFDDINGNLGNDTIDGGSGGNDWLVGGQANDLITAHAGQNILYGNLGNDTLMGGNGGDTLRGGQGDDIIVGGSGNDWISGDRGSDTLTGGLGADTFHGFSGIGLDIVTDFNSAQGDKIQLDAGTQHTTSQVGADTVIDLGGGDEILLRNVQASSLPAGSIFLL
ncbi:MAG: calcium-binding protein [Phenylobacterium sp.]|nr:MAG: calcium-binding protein [Phenylobacterium sp.]